jgi:hypothetical protein
MRAVIIQKADDADDFFISFADLLLNQVIAYQITDRLGAILITEAVNALIKGRQEIFF